MPFLPGFLTKSGWRLPEGRAFRQYGSRPVLTVLTALLLAGLLALILLL